MAWYSWQLTLAGVGLLPAAVRRAAHLPADRRAGLHDRPRAGRGHARRRSRSPSSAPTRSAPTASRTARRRGSTRPSTPTPRPRRGPRCSSPRASPPACCCRGLVVAAVVGVGTLDRRGRRPHPRRAPRLPLPGPAVHRPGADGHRGAQRAAERRSPAGGACSPSSTPRPTSPTPVPTASTCSAGPSTCRFEDVSLRLPRRAARAARTSTSTCPPDARVAVVGETGSGKTTLAKLLTRLMDPAAGRVLLDGVDLREIRFSSLRERVVHGPAGGVPPRRDARRRTSRWGAPGRLRRRDARARSPSSGCSTGSAACRAGLHTPVGPARRVAVGGGAAAGRAGPRLPRRPRPARPRRGDLRRRPGDGGAAPAGARRADPRPHVGGDRPPAVHRRGRRPGRRRRRRAGRRRRPARRPARTVRASTSNCTRAGPARPDR